MSAPLRVGLNLAFLVQDSGGSGRYARELIPRMIEEEPGLEITAWVGSTAPRDLQEEPWADEVQWIRLPVPGVGTPWHLWYELAAIGVAASRRKLDVVHGLAYLGPLVHPGVASVITILDVIWLHFPETAGKRFHAVMRVLTPMLGRSADRVIAISEAARGEIAGALRLDPAKFDVTPLGIVTPPQEDSLRGGAQARERLGLGPAPIVLCVAAKRPHKNLHGLIRAMALLGDSRGEEGGPPPQLVLPGSPNAYEDELRDLARQLSVADRVHFLGWISDAELADLYEAASCFVLPTLQEGFGLPVLEAMARGLPVACSEIPVLSEVVGDAALLFDPGDPSAIAASIAQLTCDRDLARELVRRGRERCRMFTWERTAQATLASYHRAVNGE